MSEATGAPDVPPRPAAETETGGDPARPGGDADEAESLLSRLRANGEIPTHVAVIMDGNGRWARERDLPRWEGHRRGMEAVRACVKGALAAGVEHLTLYAFSQQNWERPRDEVEALMELLEDFVEREKEELLEQGVRAQVFGDLERLPDGARAAVEELHRFTRPADRLHLHIAISYGSRAEIVQAARKLARLSVLGAVRPEEIDEERFSEQLYTAGWPDPDLLIRTSGERRISNFLLWQIAYSELYLTPVLWPEFDRAELYRALLDFQDRERRYGRVEA